jgi:hypothetical protein
LTPALIAITGALLTVILCWALTTIQRVGELHHGYIGVALLFVPVPWAQYVGLYLLLDDDVQHAWEAVQLLWHHKIVNDFTPAHWIGVGIGLLIDKVVGKDVV